MLRLASIFVSTLALALAGCSPSDQAASAPDTATTAPEDTAPAQPSVGSPPKPGGGVPGSSNESNDRSNPDGTTADPTFPRETPNS